MLFRTRYVPKMNGWNSIGLQYNICGKMHLFLNSALENWNCKPVSLEVSRILRSFGYPWRLIISPFVALKTEHDSEWMSCEWPPRVCLKSARDIVIQLHLSFLFTDSLCTFVAQRASFIIACTHFISALQLSSWPSISPSQKLSLQQQKKHRFTTQPPLFHT